MKCDIYKKTLDNKLMMIKNHLEKGRTLQEIASDLCMSTGVPLAICYMYLMLPEVHGSTPELEESLKSIVKFYNYKEITPFSKKNESI